MKICSSCGKLLKLGYSCPNCKNKRYNKRNSLQDKFRNSVKWQKKRKEILTNAKNLCEVCRDKGELNYSNISIHHITPLLENMNEALNNYNLIALCSRCHKEAEEGKIDKQYMFELAEKREAEY